MNTVLDVLVDINNGILAYNMVEDKFLYRLVYFVNYGNKGTKHYVEVSYNDLRTALENIIRGNLATTNSIVIAQTTTPKNGKCVCLQSRSYAFSLNEYFQKICETKEKVCVSNNYGRRKVQWR